MSITELNEVRGESISIASGVLLHSGSMKWVDVARSALDMVVVVGSAANDGRELLERRRGDTS